MLTFAYSVSFFYHWYILNEFLKYFKVFVKMNTTSKSFMCHKTNLLSLQLKQILLNMKHVCIFFLFYKIGMSLFVLFF